jgi:hypothetical protein
MRKNVIILTSMGYFYLALYYGKGAGLGWTKWIFAGFGQKTFPEKF